MAAARMELLKAEKELTRRSDELARKRQELPWVRVDKDYRFETDEGKASLADLSRGRSQLLIIPFHVRARLQGRLCDVLDDRRWVQRDFAIHLANHDVTLSAVSAGSVREAASVQAADGLGRFPGPLRSAGDFNADFNVRSPRNNSSAREASNTTIGASPAWQMRDDGGMANRMEGNPVADNAAMAGTDVATYIRERPGMSAFALEDGVVYYTYSRFCARTGRPLGNVSMARPRAQGPQ